MLHGFVRRGRAVYAREVESSGALALVVVGQDVPGVVVADQATGLDRTVAQLPFPVLVADLEAAVRGEGVDDCRKDGPVRDVEVLASVLDPVQDAADLVRDAIVQASGDRLLEVGT